MTKTTSNEELARRIEQLVREHIAESRRTAAEAVARAFTGASGVGAGGRKATVPKRRAEGKRRDPEEVAALGERLYAAVCASPGQGMAAFARELGASVRDLQRPMTHLKRAERIRSVGVRHLTRYFPMAADAGSP